MKAKQTINDLHDSESLCNITYCDDFRQRRHDVITVEDAKFLLPREVWIKASVTEVIEVIKESYNF